MDELFLLLRNTPPRPASNQQTHSECFNIVWLQSKCKQTKSVPGSWLDERQTLKNIFVTRVHAHISHRKLKVHRPSANWVIRTTRLFFTMWNNTKKNHYVHNSSSRRRESGPLTWRDYAAAMMTMKISETFSFSSLQWLMKISKIIFDEKLPQWKNSRRSREIELLQRDSLWIIMASSLDDLLLNYFRWDSRVRVSRKYYTTIATIKFIRNS